MFSRLPLIFLFAALGSLAARAQDYQVIPLPNKITAFDLKRIQIETGPEIVWGKLPKHPKIIWLENSTTRIRPGRHLNFIDFVATAPGLIEFPPLPVTLDNEEFFIRLDSIEVTENDTPIDDTRLEIFWDGSPDPPKEVHLGEAVELRILEMVVDRNGNARRAIFTNPSSRLEGSQWHQFIRRRGQKAQPRDFFFNFSNSNWGRPIIFSPSYTEFGGQTYRIRRYVKRLYFTELGMASGHIGATIGTSSRAFRTHLIHFKTKVLPLPPIPNEQALNSGLVGDWAINSRMSPRQPLPGEKLEIRIGVRGKGNPNLRKDWDFSKDGFPSSEISFDTTNSPNYEEWEGLFTQTLHPTGKVGTLPALTIAHFDTVKDEWKLHEITPTVTLPGVVDIAKDLSPRGNIGSAVVRPVLLNLPPATFGIFAIAPFLPFLFGFLKKRLDARDPVRDENAKKLRTAIATLQSGEGNADLIDREVLPVLRYQYSLPSGSSAKEIADVVEDDELAASLRAHAEASFSSTAKPVDFAALAKQLSRVMVLFLVGILSFGTTKAEPLEEANEAFAAKRFAEAVSGYEALIEEQPGRASLYFNLAQAHLSSNNPARARAACHTALLLDPLNAETRTLMAEIRSRQGDLTGLGNRFLDMRPDQWLVVAVVIWVLGFLYLGIRKLKPLPAWPGMSVILIALAFVAMAFWQQNQRYAAEQYMIIAEELPRELEAGTPDWDFPALRSGEIVQISETTKTHAKVGNAETPFWLPITELQQVW